LQRLRLLTGYPDNSRFWVPLKETQCTEYKISITKFQISMMTVNPKSFRQVPERHDCWISRACLGANIEGRHVKGFAREERMAL
jgi:hypothetical protein